MSDRQSPAGRLYQSQNRAARQGVRVLVTGQVGLDKQPFLERVVETAASNGRDVQLFNVGGLMCAEAPDVVPRRILDLPRARLDALRRSVFKDILAVAATGANIIVNTHATFRWKHGLFHAFDHEQIVSFDADLYVTLVDNVDAVHERLEREHELRHTLKDILVWREEEVVVTETMAEAVSGYGHSVIMSRNNPSIGAKALYRLMFEPKRKRVYPSFPMTHVLGMPDVLREIESFRDALAEHFITFDPADLDEKRLLLDAGQAEARGEDQITLEVNGRSIQLAVAEVNGIARDIDAQIYARDFKLIDQSDMIVSYIPALPDGSPALSSGVERELQHAHESTKEVYVIWGSKKEPSPFVTETATKVFHTLNEFFVHCQSKGYLQDFQLPLN